MTIEQRLWTILLAISLGASCSKKEPERPQKALAESKKPELRLDRNAVPIQYSAALTIDPRQETFQGEIKITMNVRSPTKSIWLNATNLNIKSVVFLQRGKSIPARSQTYQEDFLELLPSRVINAGKVVATVEYEGLIESNDTVGVFRQQSGGKWYAFTQFEALYARRAFPCFDEPDNKVPWTLSIQAPEGMKAFSNTPAEAQGSKRTQFLQTKPLPSYLLAFAVGPFDVVDLGSSQNGTPIRAITPKGRGSETAFVKEATAPLLHFFEDYFGIPYPYKKLDIISIPSTVNFGAMENPGLITYSERLLLATEANMTLGYKKAYASVGAHELAHQWFGNLVTHAWWDSIWLNEAFATWISNKAVEHWKPQWTSGIELPSRRHSSMLSDELVTARRIHNPIVIRDDVGSAFDRITYSKGGSVIHMFETYLGPKTFQKRVQGYLKAHAWENATTQDFLAALSVDGDSSVAPAFATFLNQVGTPELTFSLECEAKNAPTLKIKQKRYLPIGSKGDADEEWLIPICMRHGFGKAAIKSCFLLDEPESTVSLGKGGCPSWINLNKEGAGYYRSALQKPLSPIYSTANLTVAESATFAFDLYASVMAGKSSPQTLFRHLSQLSKSDKIPMVTLSAGLLSELSLYLPESSREEYSRYVTKLFRRRGANLKLTPSKGESTQIQEMRDKVITVLAVETKTLAIQKDANLIAKKWLAGKNVDANALNLALPLAPLTGGDELLQTLQAGLATKTSMLDRRLIFKALGRFVAPKQIDAALALILDPSIDIRESIDILKSMTENRHAKAKLSDFLTTHGAFKVERMPVFARARLARSLAKSCDDATRDALVAFMNTQLSPHRGGVHAVKQATERVDLCIAKKKALAIQPGDFSSP